MARQPDPESIFAGLTSKQHEVLALVADHRTSKEIASELQISESAVNQRIEAVRARLGGPPRAQMARSYREFAAARHGRDTYKKIPWQRIQLPESSGSGQVAAAESVADAERGHPLQEGDGLQLSANSLVLAANDATGSDVSPVLLLLSMLAIVGAGMTAAYFVTAMVGIG